MHKKMLLNSFVGMCVVVFLLHLILVLKSLDAGQITMVLDNKLKWTDFNTYLYEFFTACWTGLMIPFAFSLLGNTKRHEAVGVVINFILLFTVYFLWTSFIFGLSFSPLSIGLLLGSFVLLDFWIIYAVEYMFLQKKVASVNIKLNQLNTSHSAFMREQE